MAIFDHAHPKIIPSTFILYFIPSAHFWDTVNFKVHDQSNHTHFWPCPPPKIFNHLLIYMNLFQHVKNQLIPFAHSWDTVSFRVPRPDLPRLFFTMPNQKIFDQLLIFENLYQHAKNEAISSICSGETVDLKILQSNWLRAFWTISQEQDFSLFSLFGQKIYSKCPCRKLFPLTSANDPFSKIWNVHFS